MELDIMTRMTIMNLRELIGKYLMEKPVAIKRTSEELVMDIASQVASYKRDKIPDTLEEAILYLRRDQGNGVIKFGHKDIYKRTMDLCKQRRVCCPASSGIVEKIGNIIHGEKVKIINNINDKMPYIPALIKEDCKMRILKELSASENFCVYSGYTHHIKLGEIEESFENDILILSKRGIFLIQIGDSDASLRAFAMRRMMAEIPEIENNIHSLAYIENPGPDDVTTRSIKVFSNMTSMIEYIESIPETISSEKFKRVKDRLEEERIPPIRLPYTQCLNNYYGYYMDLAILENKWKEYIAPIEREAQSKKEARKRKEKKTMKKIIGIILSVAMMLTMMPTMAFANQTFELNNNEDAGLWVSDLPNASTWDDIYNGYGVFADDDATKFYFVHWDGENEKVSPWTYGTDSFKLYNEKGKDCTNKFEILKDEENGGLEYVRVKSEKTTGYYALSYIGDDGRSGYFWIDANMWSDVRSQAKANKATVKATPAKKSATLKLSYKGMYDIDGYQIYKSAKKTSGFKKAATTSNAKYTLKNLKSKKVCYVKVRTYKVYNGKAYYGKWSKVVKVKAK